MVMLNTMDKHLVAEHAIREHVRGVHESISDYLMTAHGVSEYSAKPTIEYAAADGGSWTITHYTKGISVSSRGAELHRVHAAFIAAFDAQHGNCTLRALIAGPSND